LMLACCKAMRSRAHSVTKALHKVKVRIGSSILSDVSLSQASHVMAA
jgi:hypothetical protein